MLSKYRGCNVVDINNNHGQIVSPKNCIVRKYISNRNKYYVTFGVNSYHTSIYMYRSEWQ